MRQKVAKMLRRTHADDGVWQRLNKHQRALVSKRYREWDKLAYPHFRAHLLRDM